jgi:hypothetical protein
MLTADRDDMVGTFRELDCAILTKCKKLERPKQGHRKLAEVWDISTQSWEYMMHTTQFGDWRISLILSMTSRRDIGTHIL